MRTTKEIRWFFNKPNSHVEEWFQNYNLKFSNNPERADNYLEVDNDEIGIKLRQGDLEIKKRLSQPRARTRLFEMIGYYEQWIKWNFPVDSLNDDILQVTDIKNCDWIQVVKNRLLVQIRDDKGNLKVLPASEHLNHGCQLEYSKIKVNNKHIYYTLCFEWFGGNQMKFNPDFIKGLIGDSKFKIKDSMGYPEFLKTY